MTEMIYEHTKRMTTITVEPVGDGIEIYIEMGNEYESAYIVLPKEEARKMASAILSH